jgi:hypothetical protein
MKFMGLSVTFVRLGPGQRRICRESGYLPFNGGLKQELNGVAKV